MSVLTVVFLQLQYPDVHPPPNLVVHSDWEWVRMKFHLPVGSLHQ